MMPYSDDDEDIYPNPDITIEYAVDMDQNEGEAGIQYFIIFLIMRFSDLKPEETLKRDVFHSTSIAVKQVMKLYIIVYNMYNMYVSVIWRRIRYSTFDLLSFPWVLWLLPSYSSSLHYLYHSV